MDRDTQIVVLKALRHIIGYKAGWGYAPHHMEELTSEIAKLEQYNTEYAENKKAAFPSTIPSDD